MADIQLKAYTENGGVPSGQLVAYLDIITDATPQESPKIKTLTPIYSRGSYTVFIRQDGTKWAINGRNVTHKDDIRALRGALEYIFKVVVLNPNLPGDIADLDGKFIRILSLAVPLRVVDETVAWRINAIEARDLNH